MQGRFSGLLSDWETRGWNMHVPGTMLVFGSGYPCQAGKCLFAADEIPGGLREAMLGGVRCLLMKPVTYMNNSGEAVAAAAEFYKLKPEQVLVLYDDISLPPGKLRIRRKGSAGGHNGIKSIIALLGSDEFPALKLVWVQSPIRRMIWQTGC